MMTDKTMEAVEAEAYEGFRCKAVKCMRAMGVPDVDDSWEGMMKAVDYVRDHANREGEFSGAFMAAAMWMHGFCEQETAAARKKAMEMVDREVAAAMEETKDGPAEAAGAHEAAATPSAAPSSAK